MALAVTYGLADQNQRIAAVLLAVLVTLLVSAPYVAWRSRVRARQEPPQDRPRPP